MIAVIFELEPRAECKDEYFTLALELKKILQDCDGFISVERFQSLQNSDKYLSLSFWQDEAAVKKWRQQISHRDAQKRGRECIFEHYRLRVASVVRDYSLTDREQVPETTL